MTDYIKGFIVHLDKDISSEYCEEIKTALRMVKCVREVEPLISTFDDQIAYLRGRSDVIQLMSKHLRELVLNQIKGTNP